MKSFLQGNDIERFLAYNKRKSAVDFSIKTVYTEKLDKIVNEYNTTYHRTIKLKPVNLTLSTYIGFIKKIIRKILNFKLMIMLEYQNIKIFLEKGSEEVFMIKKLKKFCIGHMLLVVGADIVGSFCKKKKKKKIEENKSKRA